MHVEPPEYIAEPKIPVDASRYERNQGAVQARGDAPSAEVLPTGASAAEIATDAALMHLDRLESLTLPEGAASSATDRAEQSDGQKSEDEELIIAV